MLYHKTKDPYVRQFLGYKYSSNTGICINIGHTLCEEQTDGFTVKVAEKPDDVKTLLEVGFDTYAKKITSYS